MGSRRLFDRQWRSLAVVRHAGIGLEHDPNVNCVTEANMKVRRSFGAQACSVSVERRRTGAGTSSFMTASRDDKSWKFKSVLIDAKMELGGSRSSTGAGLPPARGFHV
jgi:hypothetical protein